MPVLKLFLDPVKKKNITNHQHNCICLLCIMLH